MELDPGRAPCRLVLVVILSAVCFTKLGSCGLPSASDETVAVNQLVVRVIPKWAKYFVVDVVPRADGSEYFTVGIVRNLKC
jgi:hypothetical protein